MLDLSLKQGFRLNRLIGYSFLFYTGLTLQSVVLATPADWVAITLVSLSAISTLAFMLVNEMGLKTFKSVQKADPVVLDKLSLLLPMVAGAYMSLNYLLLGQLGPLLFLTLSILMCQSLGHFRLAKVATAAVSLLFLVSLALGYPKLIALSLGASLGQIKHTGFLLFLQVMPFLMTLLSHHSVTASLSLATKDKVSKLQSLAATDGLTGLINRRQFNNQLHSEIARARRNKKPLSLALFDIDDFKKINDFYGHQVGDRILKELGQVIIDNVRESDIPARYGGEEFALILPETRQTEAYEILERLRALIERTVFCLPDNPITTSVSVGISQLEPKESTIFDLVEHADNALYDAKRNGKNRVVFGVLPTPKINLSTAAPKPSLSSIRLGELPPKL